MSEAAAIGLLHELKGNAIQAYVILRAGLEGSEALAETVRDRVGHEMGPIAKLAIWSSTRNRPARPGLLPRRAGRFLLPTGPRLDRLSDRGPLRSANYDRISSETIESGE